MAKRRKSNRMQTYHECMSGPKGEIHTQRKILKADLCKKQGKRTCNINLTPKQAGKALSLAAKVCKH